MQKLFFVLLMLSLSASAHAQGFARADGPREWSFPADHGSHPEYAVEWWYFTGSLRDAKDQRYGFELTFFRNALRPDTVEGGSPWRTRDIILAHLAVSDIEWDAFRSAERVQRAAAGLAGAAPGSASVYLGDWKLENRGDGFHISAFAPRLGIELDLQPLKPPVLHGDGGWSIKSHDKEQASYYYSMPRLRSRGSLKIDGRRLEVEGLTWMDHEFFSGATPVEGLGWDWFSARLDDGRDLMLYRVRPADGSANYHFGSLIDREGRAQVLSMEDFVAEPLDFWTSPDSGRRYPVAWRLELPSVDLDLEVRALLPQQEILAEETVGFPYWEGLSSYRGSIGGKAILGEGYVELTGY